MVVVLRTAHGGWHGLYHTIYHTIPHIAKRVGLCSNPALLHLLS